MPLFTFPIDTPRSLPVMVLTLGLMLLGPDLSPVHGLRCYSCSVTANSGDKRCISDPGSVEGQSVVNCNRKYCTIQRQEMLDPPDKINTFLRGCEEDPLFLNDVLEDSTFRTYYRSCSTDLCNSGDGQETSTGFSGLDTGASENLLVPGLIGSAPITGIGSSGGCLLVLSLFVSIMALIRGTVIA
ncbi:AAEL011588-PA [Aedes aegypti]|uniref:AAEL011588-PA n=1 Tax=Aedes aegypti TaxID=7159 RepID=Q16PM2_AEDAE|nr:AAEL011588-PA [Aedes aegypti]